MSTGDPKNRPAPAPQRSGAATPEPKEAPSVVRNESGRVKFDDRGNAIWEWSVSTGAFGHEITTDRMKKLENSALSLEEDTPPNPGIGVVQSNPHGTVKGYDPYDSGKLGKTRQAPKKTDLRKLGDWLKLKKQVANKKNDEE